MPFRFNRRVLLAALASLPSFAAISAFAQTRAQEQARSSANLTTGNAPLARRLADYVESIRFADLDGPTIERAKIHLLDSLGCGLSAFAEETVQSVRALAVAAGGNAATIIGTKQRTSLEWAAFANGAAIRADDINDGYSGGNGHPSDNIAACLPVAEAEGASGADLLLSMVLAYEIQCRLLDARRAGEEDWDHPNYALTAGALAAGKLMKLSAPMLTEAISLALTGHLSMRQTRLGELSNWKGLAGPDAARNSVFAAQLARAGISGPTPIFEGDAGFFKLVSGPMSVDTSTFGGRGRQFRIHDCFIKSYPAQGQTQTAVPAATKVAQAVGDLSRIRSIEIRTTRLGWYNAGRTPDRFAPETPETADHSLPYIVARAMVEGTITPKSYAPEVLHDPRVVALLKVTTVREDPTLTALAPRQSPNIVTATLEGGRVVSERVDDLAGFAGRPMQRADVEDKFRRITNSILTNAQIARIAQAVWDIDRSNSVRALIDSMAVLA
jgi:2-methylcitrate dehydratase